MISNATEGVSYRSEGQGQRDLLGTDSYLRQVLRVWHVSQFMRRGRDTRMSTARGIMNK